MWRPGRDVTRVSPQTIDAPSMMSSTSTSSHGSPPKPDDGKAKRTIRHREDDSKPHQLVDKAVALGLMAARSVTTLFGSAVVGVTPATPGAVDDIPKDPTAVTILFGSQSGTAARFAKAVAAAAGRHNVSVVNLNAFEPASLPTLPFVVLVVATAGNGEPTDSARAFYAYLGVLAPDSLTRVQFTVFGLGNKLYDKYNAMGRYVNERMEALGARRFYRHGEGDAFCTLEDEFQDWKAGLWDALQQTGMILGAVPSAPALHSPALPTPRAKTNPPRLTYDLAPAAIQDEDAPPRNYSDAAIDCANDHFFHHTSARLVSARQLRQSTATGSTFHLEFELDHSLLGTYKTANTMAVLPQNDPTLVARVATALHYDRTAVVVVSPLETRHAMTHPFPTPATIDRILTQYVDLSMAPRKSALAALAHYATSASDQDRLLFLASPEGKAEYDAWVKAACRTFGDVIEAFPSLHVPLAAFLHLVPALQPRSYTIASSHLVHPTRIHITLGVLATPSLPGNRSFVGVTSNYLSKMAMRVIQAPNNASDATDGVQPTREWPSIRMTVRKSTFKLPSSSATPIIMIGPGTGIAPMRAFLQERQHQRNAGEAVGPTWLFFGCRRQADDYIYQDELAAYEADGTLSQLHVAFSRDTAQKVYVQHLIKQQGEALWALLAAGAH
ncbi:hypothetical protein As57867_004564, partial [Aphanomyces stellatus]